MRQDDHALSSKNHSVYFLAAMSFMQRRINVDETSYSYWVRSLRGPYLYQTAVFSETTLRMSVKMQYCLDAIHENIVPRFYPISAKEGWSFLQVCQETFSPEKRWSNKRTGNPHCTGRRRASVGTQVCRKCCITFKRGNDKFRK